MELFKELDFEKCTGLPVDTYKTIAFKFGQTIPLIQGEEIYTKGDVALAFPDLKPFMYREAETIMKQLNVLNKYKKVLLDLMLGVEIKQQGGVLIHHHYHHCNHYPFPSSGITIIITFTPTFYESTTAPASTTTTTAPLLMSLTVTIQTDLLMFSVPDPSSVKEWNQLSYQSRGLLVDYRQDSGCIFYPLNHWVKLHTTPSWPTDDYQQTETPLPKKIEGMVLVHVYKHNGQVCFCGEDSWTNEAVSKTQELAETKFADLKSLDFDEHYHTLGVVGDEVVMVSVRVKNTLDLVPSEELKHIAKEVKLPS